ncbi:MAG: AAA family ATPase [Caldilineaceae bacterium]
MQIELIGCTSAGKSTLIREILQASRAQGIDIVQGDDFILQQFGLGWCESSPFRGLLMNGAALVACLITWQKNYSFYRFATRLLWRLPIPSADKRYMLRNVFKKVGVHAIIQRLHTGSQIVLVDEGVLQIAHNLFVHVTAQVDRQEVSTFVKLISLPDVVVYLRQPESLLIDRIMARGHHRLPDRSQANVARFVKQANAVFDQLTQHPTIARRLLTVDDEQQSVVKTTAHDNAFLAIALAIVQNAQLDELEIQCAPATVAKWVSESIKQPA